MLKMSCIGFLFFMECTGSSSTSTTTVCPTIRERSPGYQRQLGAELRQAGPALRSMSQEWLDLRDQARACRRRGGQ